MWELLGGLNGNLRLSPTHVQSSLLIWYDTCFHIRSLEMKVTVIVNSMFPAGTRIETPIIAIDT